MFKTSQLFFIWNKLIILVEFLVLYRFIVDYIFKHLKLNTKTIIISVTIVGNIYIIRQEWCVLTDNYYTHFEWTTIHKQVEELLWFNARSAGWVWAVPKLARIRLT